MDTRKNTLEILQKQYKNVKGEQKTNINKLLKLYKDGHIFNKATAQQEINNYLSHAKTPLERELRFHKTMTKYLSSSHSTQIKKHIKSDQIKLKSKQIIKDENEKIRVDVQNKIIDIVKPTLSSKKIGKLARRTTLFNITEKETAFKGNVKSVIIKSKYIGNSKAEDIRAFVAASYLKARREIPRDATFKIWAGVKFKVYEEEKVDKMVSFLQEVFLDDKTEKET
jgi:hypothetical protein